MNIGLPLEKACSRALEHLNVGHSHNDFDWKYCMQLEGIDVRTDSGHEIECKNLSGKYRVSYKWIDEEIVSRFSEDAKSKTLVISHNIFSENQLYYIQANGIYVIDLGFQVKCWNIRKAIHLLIKQLYWLTKHIVEGVSQKINVVNDRVSCVVSGFVSKLSNLDVNQSLLTDYFWL
jgi:hypothetical protein